jgi:hypothetical protein
VCCLPLERLRVKGDGRALARRPATPHSPVAPIPISRPPLSAGLLDDLYSFDPADMTWTQLSAADDAVRPSARSGHGFTSAGGRLYVHGGIEFIGEIMLRGRNKERDRDRENEIERSRKERREEER